MKKRIISLAMLFAGLVMFGCRQASNSETSKSAVSDSSGAKTAVLKATTYNSGFAQGHTTWNALSTASDGKVYYVLCTDVIDAAAQMFAFDPRTQKIEHLGDLSEICGQKGMKVVPQGKSHVNFVESKGKLYFATHVGYFDIKGGREELSTSLENDYKPYPGGHVIAYDLKSKTFEDLGRPYDNEGIIDMSMDTTRGLIYGVTWPTGNFFRYDLANKKFDKLGPFTMKGEAGTLGKDYRVLCRAIVVNEDNGDVYITTSDGQIMNLKLGQDALQPMEGVNMRKDYFGKYDVSKAVTMGYNWRQAFWYAPEKVVYGVHGNSGYLFRFDPNIPRVDVLDRLTSLPSKLAGMDDLFPLGYLGFELGPDGRTIYYFTGSPIPKSASDTSARRKGEGLHLITYDIPTQKYTDNGLVSLPDGQSPREVQSIAITKDAVYGLGTFTDNGKRRTDLFSIPNPLQKQ
jgi:hypothetical protein